VVRVHDRRAEPRHRLGDPGTEGRLKGTQQRDGNRIVAELPDNDDRTIDISWPEFESLPVDVLVKAIVAADVLTLFCCRR
jgi:hypothetical protein